MKTPNHFTIIILLLILLVHIPDEINAQEKKLKNKNASLSKNEIFVEVGLIPLYGQSYDPPRFFGPIQIGYSRSIVKWLNIGLNIGYNRYKGDTYGWIFGFFKYKSDRKLLTLNVSFEFNYLHRPKVRLFSGVEAGVGFTSWDNYFYGSKRKSSGIGSGFSFQINLFSCRVGIGNHFGFLADVGIGLRGLINVGFFTKF
ncbi:MAG: hypothetical protein H8E51_08885 [Bacteroidetes bacterium]|nr:hypothetical protein [Bacteroidota bacterium]